MAAFFAGAAAFPAAFFAAFFAMVLLLPRVPSVVTAVLPGKSTDANHRLRFLSDPPTVEGRVQACAVTCDEPDRRKSDQHSLRAVEPQALTP